jgi:pyridoxine 4-dehydrogenase
LTTNSTNSAAAAGTFTLADDLTVNRMGFGAMQLAGGAPGGPIVFGPPADPAEAAAVLREAIALGVDHIDTSDFYGPFVVNQLIRETLAPYPDGLHLVTKVGSYRDKDGGWPHARTPVELRRAVHDNLINLGLEALDLVNLRVGGGDDAHSAVPGSIAEPFEALAEMQREGLIHHLGISTVDIDQVEEARAIAPLVCVQNFYNLANRGDDELVDHLAEAGIAYVPYFPLGGFSPLQSETLDAVADRLGTTPMSTAIAWLLKRSPNILLIPGTSSVEHLRQNVAAASLELSPEDVTELDGVAEA